MKVTELLDKHTLSACKATRQCPILFSGVRTHVTICLRHAVQTSHRIGHPIRDHASTARKVALVLLEHQCLQGLLQQNEYSQAM